jgi:hypothetical protein
MSVMVLVQILNIWLLLEVVVLGWILAEVAVQVDSDKEVLLLL